MNINVSTLPHVEPHCAFISLTPRAVFPLVFTELLPSVTHSSPFSRCRSSCPLLSPFLSYILCSLLSPPSLSPHFLLSPSLSGFTTISISLFRKLIRDEVNAISALSPAGARATSGELGPRSIRPLVYSSDRPVLRSVRFIKTTCLHVLSSLFLVVYILAPVILSTYHPLSSAVGGAEFEEALKAAVQMNVYNKRAAAAAHLCLAWSQAIDVSVLGSGGSIFSGSRTPPMTPCVSLPSYRPNMCSTDRD
jgi:hypothetical protein